MAHQLTQLPAGGEAIPKDRMVWIEAALLRSLAASHADARQDFLNVLGLQAEATRAALILLKAAGGSGGPAMELVARWSAGGESFGADELRLYDFGVLDDSPHRPAWLSFPGPAGARSLALPFRIARQEIEHAPPPGDAGVVVLELRGSAGPPDAALGLDPDRISFL
ncbi:MAG TPA: hypothetical protein VFD71_02505, partial [Planctomycetota bacterium]|nr:hypothetical protein [Planctomycetota bacterium]